MMKKTLVIAVVLMLVGISNATLVVYDGLNVQIDGEVGTGSSQTMVVIDWLSGVTQSHAWLYKYDGSKTVADGFDAIQTAVATFSWSGGPFVSAIDYNDGTDNHQDFSGGWISFWNKDSGNWATNGLGVSEQLLKNSGWSGSVVNDTGTWGDIPPVVPVPEPTTIALFGIGAILFRRRKTA